MVGSCSPHTQNPPMINLSQLQQIIVSEIVSGTANKP
jgi:hypothetical protein